MLNIYLIFFLNKIVLNQLLLQLALFATRQKGDLKKKKKTTNKQLSELVNNTSFVQ